MKPEYMSSFEEDTRQKLDELALQMKSQVLPRVEYLTSLEILSEDELEELQKLVTLIQGVQPMVNKYMAVLNGKILKATNDIFFHARELALLGNEEAKRLYEEMRPVFESKIREDLERKLN